MPNMYLLFWTWNKTENLCFVLTTSGIFVGSTWIRFSRTEAYYGPTRSCPSGTPKAELDGFTATKFRANLACVKEKKSAGSEIRSDREREKKERGRARAHANEAPRARLPPYRSRSLRGINVRGNTPPRQMYARANSLYVCCSRHLFVARRLNHSPR